MARPANPPRCPQAPATNVEDAARQLAASLLRWEWAREVTLDGVDEAVLATPRPSAPLVRAPPFQSPWVRHAAHTGPGLLARMGSGPSLEAAQEDMRPPGFRSPWVCHDGADALQVVLAQLLGLEAAQEDMRPPAWVLRKAAARGG